MLNKSYKILKYIYRNPNITKEKVLKKFPEFMKYENCISEYVIVTDNNVDVVGKYEEKLIKSQRKLSKRKKGSNNRNKQRLKVNKWHKKIANCRIDFLQKLSTKVRGL